jgi:hypothetical protein
MFCFCPERDILLFMKLHCAILAVDILHKGGVCCELAAPGKSPGLDDVSRRI